MVVQAMLMMLGRIMLCTIFVMSAVGNKIPKFEMVAGYMAGAGVPQPKVMLAGAIVFLILGSFSVIVGYKARIGATLLLVFLILATYYFHPIWAIEPDAEEFQNQMINFMKNLALMGAMVMIIANGSGPGSLCGKSCKTDITGGESV